MSWLGELLTNVHNWRHGTAKIKTELVKASSPLRFGVLGAAAINYAAIFDPIQTHPDAILVGLAARSQTRAEAQITKYKLTGCKAYGSYAELVADETIDAIYIPLPNGLHCEWAIKAMEAGKDVLIEKPIASNADEARKIKEVSEKTGKIALEAFHSFLYPANQRLKAIIESGKYGQMTNIRPQFLIPKGILGWDDIRFQYALAGGSSMDCVYCYSACLYLRGGNNVSDLDFRILDAKARLDAVDKRIDAAMESTMVMDSPGKKPITCEIKTDSKLSPLLGFIPRLWDAAPFVSVELEKARIDMDAFVIPAYNHSITIREKGPDGRLNGKKSSESCYVGGDWEAGIGEKWWTTYRYQLEAFVGAIRAQQKGQQWNGPWISLDYSIKLMEMVDALYDKAGLPRRGL